MSNEDMILALAGQFIFKQLSHEPEKFSKCEDHIFI